MAVRRPQAAPSLPAFAADAPAARPGRTWEELRQDFAPEEPSTLEAVARGGAQGLTLGFADEITAALEAGFTPKTYEEARAESREAYQAAQQAHPLAYGAGEVGGGLASLLVPGAGAVGAAARGGKLLSTVGRGVAAGAAYGLGTGEADLTKGEYGKALGETAKGAALGGTLAGALGLAGRGIGKVAGKATGWAAQRGAAKRAVGEARRVAAETAEEAAEAAEAGLEPALRPPVGVRAPAVPRVPPGATAAAPTIAGEAAEDITARASRNLMREIVGDVPGSQSKANPAVARRMGKVAELAEEMIPDDQELAAALGKPRRAMAVAQQRLDEAAAPLREATQLIDDAAGRPSFRADVLAEVDKEIRQIGGTFREGKALQAIKQWRKYLVDRQAEQRKLGKFGITTQDIRDIATDALKWENETMGALAETTKYRVQEKLHDIAQGLYNRRLDLAAKEMGEPGQRLVAQLRGANRKVRLYSQLRDTLKHRADKEALGARSLSEVLSELGPRFAIRKGVEIGAAAERRATRALARLVRARRSREPVPPSLVREALAEGVPDRTIHAILTGTQAASEAGAAQ